MPGRRVHVECSLQILTHLGYKPRPETVAAVETLVDHPTRARGLLREAYARLCDSTAETGRWECNALSWILSRGRLKGVGAHDWRSQRGWNLLLRILETLYGGQAVLAAIIHRALDCMEQTCRPVVECAMGDNRLAGLLEEYCGFVRRTA